MEPGECDPKSLFSGNGLRYVSIVGAVYIENSDFGH